MRFTTGYKTLMDEIRLHDFSDPYGTATNIAFGLATVAYVEFDEILPDFTPAPSLSANTDLDDYPDAMFQELVWDGHVGIDDLKAVFQVMSRYVDLLPESVKY